MFSVKTENILLNYFVLLFTIGLLLSFNLNISLLIVFTILLLSGIFLFFDKYFFFKLSFLLSILLSILFLFSLPTLNILVILILFIAISQICLSFTYFLLFPILYFHFDFLEIYLVISIFILTLIFTFLFGLRKLNREFNKKLFSNELKNRFFRHDICNLCSIIFLQNKDKNLEPILEKMRLNLRSPEISSKSSIAGLLRKTVYLLDYDYNLKIANNFFLMGDDLSWVCFFYNLLENYGKRGSTIIVQNEAVYISLKKGRRKALDRFLSSQFVKDSVDIKDGVLKFKY